MQRDSVHREFMPPPASRVAARAIALVAVSCRSVLEMEDSRDLAELKRLHVCEWLDRLGVIEELEDSEMSVLDTPYRMLDQRAVVNAEWRGEGMLVLAWALGRSELVRYDQVCDSAQVASELGFLHERPETALAKPALRDRGEISRWRDTYLTVHWRLREYQLHAEPIDFPDVVSWFNRGPLRLDGLDLVDGDLAICGRRIDRVSFDEFAQTFSIVIERHKAFNWLLGAARVYSAVSTDT